MKTKIELSVADLLQHLITKPELPNVRQLQGLSDLPRPDVHQVREHWPTIPVERRRHVIHTLVVEAQENIHLHLGQLLRVALSDEDAQVRRLAIEGLWEDHEADLIGPFVQLLHNDPDEEVRAAAATALGEFVLAGELGELDAALAVRAEEALLTILHSETEPLAVQQRALESIAYSGEIGVRQLIEDAYYSPFDEMRVSALFAMGRSADIRWRGLARAELQNPDAAMRAEAARACGELEAQAAQDDLLELLSDEIEEVRLAAIFALGRIGGREAKEALEALAAGESEVEVDAAKLALEEMLFFADSEAIPPFDEAEEDPEDWESEPWDDRWDDRDLGIYE